MPAKQNPHAAWERNFVVQMAHLREQRGMTQNEMARVLKLHGLAFHQQTVQRIEAGERPVRLDEAHLIAKVLQVDLATMTATLGDQQRELVYALDWVRREGANAAHGFAESLGEWLARVDDFSEELSERIRQKGHPLAQGGTPDQITLCALAFAGQILAVDSIALRAYTDLMVLSGEAVDVREDIGIFDNTSSLDTMTLLLERFKCPELDALLKLPPDELYTMLSDASLGEAWDNLGGAQPPSGDD